MKYEMLCIGEDQPPDNVELMVYDHDNILILKTIAEEVGSCPVSNGLMLFITYEVEGLPDGQYKVVFLASLSKGQYSASDDLYVETPHLEITDKYSIYNIVTIPNSYACKWSLFDKNNKISSGETNEADKTFSIDLSTVNMRLDPYLLVTEDQLGNYTDQRIFYICPSILGAIKDLRTYIDRLNLKLRLDSLYFSDSDYLFWLMSGRDRFNGLPLYTNFSMTGATGPIRDMWLLCSQISALRVKYLEEGLTSYQYSGAAVSLDIDITPYIEQYVSALESRLAEEGQRLKTQLHNKGQIEGSGEWTMANSNIGTFGMTLGPVCGKGVFGRRVW